MNSVTLIEMPKLYENMDEGTVISWHASPGQNLREGQVLCDLVTDKTVADFEAPVSGTLLAVFAEAKSTVPVGYVLAAIGPARSPVPAVEERNAELLRKHAEAAGLSLPGPADTKQPEKSAKAATESASKRPSYRAAPAARALARKEGVNLDDVAAAAGVDVLHRRHVEEFMARAETAKRATHSPPPASDESLWRLDGKIALVTGAGSGIGRATALALSAAGASIAVHCNRSREGAEDLKHTILDRGGNAEVFPADLADLGAAAGLVKSALEHFGTLDIVINNAGILQDAPVAFMKNEQWESVLRVNLDAPFVVTREAAMVMGRKKWGKIVNITSDAGRLGAAGRSNYAAAKEGLVGFTRSVARELAPLGVRVNAVSPGFVTTPMTESLPEKRRERLAREIPLRRFGTPEEIASTILLLCVPAGDYITGQVVSVDGGLFIG